MPAKHSRSPLEEMPYGMYIIGSRMDGEVNGMMADWLMQVSFSPRLVAVAFENDSRTLANVRDSKVFTVNLLAQDKESMELASKFAQPYDGSKIAGRSEAEAAKLHHKLREIPHTLSERGCPVLEAALAWFECEAERFVSVGDHTLVIGRVLEGAVLRDAEPMTSTYTGWTYHG